MDIFGVGAERRPRATAVGMDVLGVDVVCRDDDLSAVDKEGSKLNVGIDVLGIGALRRWRTGAAEEVDFFVLGVEELRILWKVLRWMAGLSTSAA